VGIGCHGQHDRADGAQIAQAYLLAYGPQGGCRAGDAGPQVAGPTAVDEVVVVELACVQAALKLVTKLLPKSTTPVARALP